MNVMQYNAQTSTNQTVCIKHKISSISFSVKSSKENDKIVK